MSKGIFITATGTDMGKTYVTALLIKKMQELDLRTAYYKAALSGAESLEESDAGYVNRISSIKQDPKTMVSYLYKQAYSPHLAARLEGNPPERARILTDFKRVCETYDYVVAEGSGGIVCPLRYDEKEQLLLEDVIRLLGLDALLVADAGLGTINATVLTVEYMKQKNISLRGIILNRYSGTVMEEDNRNLIESLTKVPVIAVVRPGETSLSIEEVLLKTVFSEVGT